MNPALEGLLGCLILLAAVTVVLVSLFSTARLVRVFRDAAGLWTRSPHGAGWPLTRRRVHAPDAYSIGEILPRLEVVLLAAASLRREIRPPDPAPIPVPLPSPDRRFLVLAKDVKAGAFAPEDALTPDLSSDVDSDLVFPARVLRHPRAKFPGGGA